MRFFLDNCLSPRYAQALSTLSERDGHRVVHLLENFARDTPDEAWIKSLGREGEWVIVSGDIRILKNRELAREWAASKLTAFFLAHGWMNVKYWDQVTLLVRWWPHIIEAATLVEPGSGFIVPYRSPKRFRIVFAGHWSSPTEP